MKLESHIRKRYLYPLVKRPFYGAIFFTTNFLKAKLN